MWRGTTRLLCESAERVSGLRRAFVEAEAVKSARVGGQVLLSSEASAHFGRVLRLRDGALVELFDGSGGSIFGSVHDLASPKHAHVRISEISHVEPSLPPLVVAQAWVKPSKAEEVVQRATELGASRFLFFQASRTSAKSEFRPDRLQKIAVDASRQSGRVYVPQVDTILYSSLLSVRQKQEWKGLAVLASPRAPLTLSRHLQEHSEALKQGLVVLIGPEGGFTTEEEEQVAPSWAQIVQVGPNTLRTETASLALLAVAQSVLGKM